MSVSPSQMLPPPMEKACCGTGTLNSPCTHEKDLVLLHFLPGKVFTTPLQLGAVTPVAVSGVTCAPAAAGTALARLPRALRGLSSPYQRLRGLLISIATRVHWR